MDITTCIQIAATLKNFLPSASSTPLELNMITSMITYFANEEPGVHLLCTHVDDYIMYVCCHS